MNGIDFSGMPSLKAAVAKPTAAPSEQGMSFDFDSLSAAEEGERLLTKEEEWLKSRHAMVATASEVYRLLAVTEDGSLSDGAETYCMEKAAEALTEFEPDFFISRAMQWGNEQEPFAVERFEQDMMMLIESTNEDQQFILSPDKSWGGTPDGVAPEGLDYGLEIKCPNSTTHMTYRAGIKCGGTLKEIKPVYYWQIQACMYLCGKSKWFFMSFDPRFKKAEHQSHIVEIQRNNDDINYMLEKIKLATTRRDMIVAEMDM